VLAAAALALPAAGCEPRLAEPWPLHAGFQERQLWGVAPFVNESGVSTVEPDRVADAFMAELQQVHGIDAIPVNRVIAAMRELEMWAVLSQGDARTLMNVLDLDGLVVGTVTTYDPYRPLKLGLAVELYQRPRMESWSDLDSRELTRATSGHPAAGSLGPPGPTAQAAAVLDAANHLTLKWLADYAEGRHEPDSAYGPDIYLVSMDLYTQFACYRLLRDLLLDEQFLRSPVAEASE
jgi:hypothetical protein